MYGFENDLFNLIEKIEFKKVTNCFQNRMSEDLKSIKNSQKLFIKADKTRNMYSVETDKYEILLKGNITKTYKKSNIENVNKVNQEAAKITKKLGIADRVQTLSEDPAFVTIKDHKPEFPNNIKCRLLNPSKSQVGKISKYYLEEINERIRKQSNMNEWRSTSTVMVQENHKQA